MAKDNNEIKVTFKAFNQEFNKAMKDMNQESAKLRQEMKLQSEQMKNSASESDKLKATMQGLEQRYDLAKEKTAAISQPRTTGWSSADGKPAALTRGLSCRKVRRRWRLRPLPKCWPIAFAPGPRLHRVRGPRQSWRSCAQNHC